MTEAKCHSYGIVCVCACVVCVCVCVCLCVCACVCAYVVGAYFSLYRKRWHISSAH